ncbi:MAG: T9SS type A sorting domain-containing protein [Chitinophagaceae bacterium]
MNLQILQLQLFTTFGNLNIVAGSSSLLILKVLNIQGRIAKTFTEKIEAGTHQLSLNLNDLKNGIYVLNAFCGDRFVKAIKFVKN